jgi:PAS domain S-box-containing protein
LAVDRQSFVTDGHASAIGSSPAADEHYRAIFEHPTESTVVLDAVRDSAGNVVDWRYRDLNSNALALVQRPRDQVVGRLVSEVLGERAARASASCAQALRERQPIRYEAEYSGRVFQVCLFPIGENCVVSTGTDITAATRATREVRRESDWHRAESEWLAAVLNSMTEEVYFTDPNQRYTYANPAALREFGHANVNGARVTDLVQNLEVLRPDGSPRPVDEAPPLRALRGEVITQEEQVVRTPRTGELRHRHVNAAPVRNAQGEIIGSVSVVRDITDSKRAAATLAADLRDTTLLHELAARQTAEADSTQIFVDILDAAMTLGNAQAGTIQLFDESTQELTIVAARGFPPDMTARFARVDASCGSPCGQALATRARAFTRFDIPAGEDPESSARAHLDCGIVCAQSTPLVSRTGRLLGMVSTHWSTQRTLPERELRFLDLLGRQAADIIERMQKDEALREADRRKDEFIAVLAHELRNPLVPIRTGIELLKNARSRPEVVDSVRPMMERQIAHMVRLIDDLLDVARVAAGKFELKRETVALATIVGNAVDAQRRALEAAGLELRLHLPEDPVIVDGDATRLSQVLSNLLHNASKFTPAGGHVELTASRLEKPDGDRLILSVRDDGRGIEPDQLPRIFELFAQSGSRSSSHLGGLGLGLALARKLVEMHGGRIEALSAGANLGSEFVISLPLPRSPGGVATAAVPASPVLDHARVLVVDDNHDAADSMSMLVEFGGAQTRAAYSAAEAFEVIREFRPHIVLLDIGMPGMSGYEACRNIRAEHGDAIAIVAVSGWGQDSDKELAREAGFDAHLTKPADPQELAETIARFRARETSRTVTGP